MKDDQFKPTAVENHTHDLVPASGGDGATTPQMNTLLLDKLSTNGHQKTQKEEGGIPLWRSNRLLRTFESHEQTRLFNAGRWVTFKSNEIVTQQSEAVEAILFIVEGKARAEISSPQTSSRIAVVNLLGAGDDIGLLSLVDGAPHSATVTALTELRAVSIPYQELRERLLAHPDRYRVLAEIAVERLRLSGGWLQSLI